jgi:pimeloyl-ACP methyl ester carboxylesterase
LRGKIILGVVATLFAICACLASLVGARNYRAARALFEADPPSPLLKHPDQVGVADLQGISFESAQGIHLAGWYAPSRNRAAVIITHGTNSDRASMLVEIRLLAQAGFGVLAFDWPGLGESDGPIRWDLSSRGALTAAIDWLTRRSDVDPERIGGLGFSIGGFVMAQVAATDHRLHAVVLESPPGNFQDYVRLHYTKWSFISKWPALYALRGSALLDHSEAPSQMVREISPTPALFIVGSADHEVSPEMVEKLYETARQPKSLWVVPGADHGGYAQVAATEYGSRLKQFFSDNLLAP